MIYKAEQWDKSIKKDKDIKEVDRPYSSSKTCSNCGFKVGELLLNIRNWQCPSCNTMHGRDINASLSILNNATKRLTV
ncbi:zinc ribbon domain-containing protein [Moraxella lincolnii]|uniref:Cas12f1-like TNB domain-containing protein n=1 Tax=Lwoffella lincolnii TaxID=90241 RepID=A0A1T0CD80_9GAMM|nr:hypothetical protein B0682_06510 [Moraxella lincolnii]